MFCTSYKLLNIFDLSLLTQCNSDMEYPQEQKERRIHEKMKIRWNFTTPKEQPSDALLAVLDVISE